MFQKALVTIIGRVTNDPVQKSTATGKPVTEYQVAVNDSYKTSDGYKELPMFFRVADFGKQSNAVGKGTPVVITGRMKMEMRKEGGGWHAPEVVATDVIVIGGGLGKGGRALTAAAEDPAF